MRCRVPLLLSILTLLALPPESAAGKDAAAQAVCEHIMEGRSDEAVRLLPSVRDINARDSYGDTILLKAISFLSWTNDVRLLGLVLERRPDVDAKDSRGDTPLLNAILLSGGKASSASYRKAVTMLLDAGADVNARGKDGDTPFLRAAHGKGDIARELLRRGADISVTDGHGQTALMWAANSGDDDLVNSIISRSTKDLNAQDKKFGLTALMNAAVQGRAATVRMLLLYGADPKLKSLAGQTARVLAETRGHKEAARILADYEDSLAGKRAPAPAAPKPAPAPKPAVSDADKPGYSRPTDDRKFAVVVGIESYADLPEARFASRDAHAVRAHLAALGFPERNIVSLLGSKATKAGIVKTLETWLPRSVSEESTVLFYYSGHGAPEPETGQAYLVPADGDPQYLADTAYPLSRLYEKLGGLKAKTVVVALDSCFSGTGGRSVLAKGLRPLVPVVDPGRQAPENIVSMTAADAGQTSGTDEDQGHGLFTYYFLHGLNGAAQDESGGVTVKGLYEYLRPNVQDKARRDNREQTPGLFLGRDAGAQLRLR